MARPGTMKRTKLPPPPSRGSLIDGPHNDYLYQKTEKDLLSKARCRCNGLVAMKYPLRAQHII